MCKKSCTKAPLGRMHRLWLLHIWLKYFVPLTFLSPFSFPSTLTQAHVGISPGIQTWVQWQRNQQIQALTEAWSKIQHTPGLWPPYLLHIHMRTTNTQHVTFPKPKHLSPACRVKTWPVEPSWPAPILVHHYGLDKLPMLSPPPFFSFVKCRQEHLGLFEELELTYGEYLKHAWCSF